MRPDAVRQTLDAELAAARRRRDGRAPRVLDVGGGSGVLAVPLAVAGCAVTVLEPNPNALATLSRRVEDASVADRVTAIPADSESLADAVPAGSMDLVLAHGVLEIVDDPRSTVAAMAGAVEIGGAVSVLVANRAAAVVHRAVAGRLAEARRLVDDPDGRLPEEGLLRRFDSDGVGSLLAGAGLVVESLQGQGVLSDLVPGGVLEEDSGAVEALAELELRVAGVVPLRDLATRLHAVGRRV
ncbi:SAM-dependent methyltransferase [Actinophytocola xinjiangensis]|uniref:SAM-dependent methyltransferase n=1 Tax=Actinophytocola xinjiangensis TaxID=485602 RepID=A0A7Z1AVL6_9PSEU|nr:methyltransferase domain-containing protein [Actinophytocola xinjiangensis]OLF05458.1 SAM-dependent methyltransferase [Actinophytocola xinjiangensis]